MASEPIPGNATRWSRAKMSERSGLSALTVGRIQKVFELEPRRADRCKLSSGPLFVDKVYDIIGLYVNPPDSAIVCCVD